MKILLMISVLAIALCIFVAGCAPATDQQLINECKFSCKENIAQGRNVTNGPCILNQMSNNDWVCDIAHAPRQDIDNLPENQCSAYHDGTAKHFIELTPECEFIKAQ
jgi:hypothetical protein